MRRSQAEAIVEKLNRDYIGPNNIAAFCAKRTCQTDSYGFWMYYITTPFGVYRRDNGVKVSFIEQHELISQASNHLQKNI